MPAPRVVVLLSGGMDSTVLLAHERALGRETIALNICYGQRHVREIDAAAKVAEFYNAEYHFVNLPPEIWEGSSSSQILKNEVPVPHGHYADESMKTTVVPNRNMMLLSVAAAVAISKKCQFVGYAAHAGDHAIYPDCRSSFILPMQEALRQCDWSPIELEAPFVASTKADIVRLGHELRAPFELTYSCYEGRRLHCGKCGTCTERKEAFELANVADPTKYET